MSDHKEPQEKENARLSQWHGDDLDSTAKLPMHKDTRSDEQKLREEEEHKRRMHRILWWTIAGVVILFLLVFLLGYLPRRSRNKETQKQAEQEKNATPVVQVIQVKNAPPANDLTVPGTTTPSHPG